MMRPLFSPRATGLPLLSPRWCLTRDGDPHGLLLYARHYSSARTAYKFRAAAGRRRWRFVGLGERMVLVWPEGDALFVWRGFLSHDPRQYGVNCAAFRNEGPYRSSDLIVEAMGLAARRWPGERRAYTYVDPRRVRSPNPGCCFVCAGWRRCGRTPGGLLILEGELPRSAGAYRDGGAGSGRTLM